MKRIFVDFDGTLVDVWKRYYRIFTDFFNSSISLTEYKAAKLKYPNDLEILKEYLYEDKIESYFRFKKEKLESPEYLKYDTLLNTSFDLQNTMILTCRRSKENLYEQIHNLNIQVSMDNIIVLQPHDVCTKKKYLSEKCGDDGFILIGDSELEYVCAELPNAEIYLVKTGLRDVCGFPIAKNVKIVPNINSLTNLIRGTHYE